MTEIIFIIVIDPNSSNAYPMRKSKMEELKYDDIKITKMSSGQLAPRKPKFVPDFSKVVKQDLQTPHFYKEEKF